MASPAAASTGGTTPVSGDNGGTTAGSTAPAGGGSTSDGGGTRAGTSGGRTPSGSGSKRHGGKRRARATLSSFSLSAARFYAYGAPLRVRFQIDARRATIPVTLKVLRGGALVRSVALGTLTTRAPHSYSLAGDSSLPQGALELRISAPRLRRGAHASAAQSVSYYTHRLPLAPGSFTLPPGGGFGSDRPGHIHQGQDMSAPQGTPIVAPRGGVVTTVAYQAGGAGYYVVVDGAGERYDYVFMHLVAGSTRVRVGQRVRTGRRIGDVGTTGSSSGPHLHFEIWQGAWQAGGHPVDPLPFIKRWQRQR